MADYGLKPGERLVCGNCGAFLPSDISPETHGEWECRCGGDWFVAVKRFAAPRRRTQRLPLTGAVAGPRTDVR